MMVEIRLCQPSEYIASDILTLSRSGLCFFLTSDNTSFFRALMSSVYHVLPRITVHGDDLEETEGIGFCNRSRRMTSDFGEAACSRLSSYVTLRWLWYMQ
jgi:hypothetical protein